MIINSFSAPFRFRRSAAVFLVVAIHGFVVVIFTRANRVENTAPTYSLMSIFLVRPSLKDKLIVPNESVDAATGRAYDQSKNSANTPIVAESKNTIDAIDTGDFLQKKAHGEADIISSKELASLDSLASRYNLDIPKVPLEVALTPAQQAAQDPRTNSARLIKSEKFAVALGTLDCIFQTRLANGEIIRVPRRWAEMPARSEPGRVSLTKVRFCVRAQQAEGEEGSDLTAVTTGLRGK